MAYVNPQVQIDQQQNQRSDQNQAAIGQGIMSAVQSVNENRRRAVDAKYAQKKAENDQDLHNAQMDELNYKKNQRGLSFDQQDDFKKATALERLKSDGKVRIDPLELHKQKLAATAQSQQDVAANSKKQLSADTVLKVNEGAAVPKMLEDIQATIHGNPELFMPLVGSARGMNPWDEKAATAQSQIKSSSQAFGKFMEGGVLRKEDETKYAKMFPQLGDTPEVAKNKLQNVQRLLINKLHSDVSALHKSGYDVSGINTDFVAPDVPSIIRDSQPVAPAKNQQIQPPTPEETAQAIQWAKSQPGNPKAQQILQAHGVK